MNDMTKQERRRLKHDRLAAQKRRREVNRRRYKRQYERRHGATGELR